MTVYKGMAIPETELNNIQSSIQSYSSTTEDKVVAEDYANKAYDIGENFARVIATVKIEKGTPIADTRQLLGNTGMHAYEKEITVGRKADYTFGKLVKHTDRYGDDYYTVNVKVRRK